MTQTPDQTPDPEQPDPDETVDPREPEQPEQEIVPLEPPDPADSELPTSDQPEPDEEPEPFADGPPPLPKPLLVLDGELPPMEEPEPVEEVDHGTCACGGKFDEDGWCTECGERRPDPRHHFSAQADERVAMVCDRGIRHESNEDAGAVWGETTAEGGHRAALVVCDGVTTATRSAEASLAASYAALEVLSTSDDDPADRLARAADAAAGAVDQVGEDFPDAAPSCTFVAAVVEDGTATVGNVGDSRGYWLPDEGEARRLTRDDSMAEEQVDSGVDRATAEAGPLAHTITRWLGPDSPDHTPSISSQDVSAPGWLMLCSDGLWNYASDPADLRAVLRQEAQRLELETRDGQATGGADPLALAQALVDWAKGRGGADNITVALLRSGAATYPQEAQPPTTRPEERAVGGAGQDGSHG
ncbi:protein phosphatase 2C domain-containing protein [Ornithinimicrobium panacihumi]|uniref:PP2C family protein-serine/threonine phosphatase n=1 Tax=Ornithinimicrobium panacihumi TaxID=2008449 RepID=UPI003F8A7DB5